MGSGGSLTLWPPSNKAGAYQFVVLIDALMSAFAFIGPLLSGCDLNILLTADMPVTRTVIDGGTSNAKRAIRTG